MMIIKIIVMIISNEGMHPKADLIFSHSEVYFTVKDLWSPMGVLQRGQKVKLIFFLSFSNPFSTFWSPGSLSCQVGRIYSPCVPLLPPLPASLPAHLHCTVLTGLGY